MNYKFLFTLLLIFVFNCAPQNESNKNFKEFNNNIFINKGFALLYDIELVSKKIDDRSLIIFQKNLPKGTQVKIKNIHNNKYLLAIVGVDSLYPDFYNAVLSDRIFKELEIDKLNPYVEIREIANNSSFIAKKAKTFSEEKNVANKAPVEDISINNLSTTIKSPEKIIPLKFNYFIKLADFYFKNTATSMIKRIENETKLNDAKIKKIANNKFRVILGPYYNLNSLQSAFNDIKILEFENIEIIKND